jgi:hypothetical protein
MKIHMKFKRLQLSFQRPSCTIIIYNLLQVLEISWRRQYLEDFAIEIYLEDILFPYISASLPGNQTLPTVIIKKLIGHSEQVTIIEIR